MQGVNPEASASEDFTDVFTQDRDRGADTAAPSDAGQPRDDNGRFAQKSEQAIEPQAKPEIQPQAAEPEPKAEDANRHVPLKELLSERERYKSEKKLREEAERRAIENEARFKAYEDLLHRQQSAPQQQQQIPTAPDPYTQPEEFARHQAQQIAHARRNDIADMSEAIARRTLGDAIVDEAASWALKNGTANKFFWQAKDPYGELVTEYKRYKTMAEIGPDPEKYKQTLEQQIREKVLAELKAGGKSQPQRFPGSLADATATGAQGAIMSPETMAHEIFDTNRNRRAS